MDEQLLLRFLKHELSAKDREKLEEWLSLDSANAEWLLEMERVWSLKNELYFSGKEEIELAFNRFLNRIGEPGTTIPLKSRRNLWNFSWLKYAAALFIIAFSIYLIQPDSTVNTLMNTVEVPRGQYVNLTLSDGTLVWLNAESKLIYPSDFQDGDREVELIGEGYFQVTENPDRPFIVHSYQLNVKVLGTKFHMKAYANEATSVMLREGEVEVSTIDAKQHVLLSPNEEARYVEGEGIQKSKNLDTHILDIWMNGDLAFRGASLESITKSLERKFDIPLVIESDDLKQERFTLRADSTLTLVEVLDLLKSTRKLDYKIKEQNIIIF